MGRRLGSDSLLVGHGVPVGTWHPELAQCATHPVYRLFYAVEPLIVWLHHDSKGSLLHFLSHSPHKTGTFFLVMPRPGDGIDRTFVNTLSACPFLIMQAVAIGPITQSGTDPKGGISNDRCQSDIATQISDKGFGKAECPQPCCKGDMPFRPV